MSEPAGAIITERQAIVRKDIHENKKVFIVQAVDKEMNVLASCRQGLPDGD